MTLADYVEAVERIRKGRCVCRNLIGGAAECYQSRHHQGWDGFGADYDDDGKCECFCHDEIASLDEDDYEV